MILVGVGILYNNARIGDLNLNLNKRMDDLRADVFARLAILEAQNSRLQEQISGLQQQYSGLERVLLGKIEEIDQRLEKIESRLDLR